MEQKIARPPAQDGSAEGVIVEKSVKRRSLPVRSRSVRWLKPVVVIGSVLIFVALWAYAASFYSRNLLPSPLDAWNSFNGLISRGTWQEAVMGTLSHLFIAFGLAVVIGIPLGVIIGRFWVVEEVARVPIIFLQTVPSLVVIAFALIFFGTNDTGIIFVACVTGLPYFTLNIIQGTKSVDRELVEMARSFRAKEGRIIISIVLPSVVPYFLAASRITLGVCWHVTLFAEYLMGASGIGYRVNVSIRLFDTPAVFAWGLSVVMLTILIEYGLFRPLEKRLTRR